MTSMPASRNARAMIFAPRSCPSRPGFAMTTLIFRATAWRSIWRWRLASVRHAVEPEIPLTPFIQVPRLGCAVGLSLRARRPDREACDSAFLHGRLREAQQLRRRTERPHDHVGRLARTVSRREIHFGD